MGTRKSMYSFDECDEFDDGTHHYTIKERILHFFKGFISPAYETRVKPRKGEEYTSECGEYYLKKKKKL